ncbi:acyl-CoA thioesterase [Afifella sp. IM 167]|uniref:acyl-CoA thioesterase n=1 Tax=Afifella sp. IM 167 TaxID=2033586 RepID=UPI001CCC1D42|nr:acyl-CoA thioesterase [Afifella sp. IM 167]MBZ8132147.1 4-hydroxybenzoyl-CoA thioesterase [Afifella sp. IM 167]
MFVFSREIEIEWGDCDPAGIVFYPRYFEMFDAATARLFEAALGEKKIAWTKRFGILGIPMVDTRAKFFIPSRYGDHVVIESQASEIRRSSFDITHRLLKEGKLAVEGFETRVWTGRKKDDPAKIGSMPIPQEVIAALSVGSSSSSAASRS